MNKEKIASNLTKIDASPHGIFFMSYDTPIAMIMGRSEWLNVENYSHTTNKHKRKLLNEGYIKSKAEPMTAERMGKLCKHAGIDCDY